MHRVKCLFVSLIRYCDGKPHGTLSTVKCVYMHAPDSVIWRTGIEQSKVVIISFVSYVLFEINCVCTQKLTHENCKLVSCHCSPTAKDVADPNTKDVADIFTSLVNKHH